jgi:hypothetical protein
MANRLRFLEVETICLPLKMTRKFAQNFSSVLEEYNIVMVYTTTLLVCSSCGSNGRNVNCKEFGEGSIRYLVKAQMVSRRLPNAAARVRVRVKSCGICGGERNWGRFSPSTSVSLDIHSTNYFTIMTIYHPGLV